MLPYCEPVSPILFVFIFFFQLRPPAQARARAPDNSSSSNTLTYFLVGSALYTLLLSPFRGQAGAPTIKNHVKLAVIRSMIEYMTIPQSQ